MENFSIKHIFAGVAGLLLFILTLIFNPFSVNDAGYRTHIQPLTGDSWIKAESGLYFSGFGSTLTKYPDVVTIQFEREENKKKDISYFSDPTKCQFSDGTYADNVGFTVKWKLPHGEDKMKQIHQDYRSHERLAESLADYAKECIQYSFQLMDSERHYSGGKSELRDYFQFQLKNGQYIVDAEEQIMIDSITGNITRSYKNVTRVDSKGNPILSTSDVQIYGIIPNFTAITLVDYEQLVDEKLKQKVEQSTLEAISKQTLVTAQQQALTAEAEGKRQIVIVEATEKAAKIKAVIIAEREALVAAENLKKARLDAQSELVKKKAQAEGDRLKVAAGLTPTEAADFKMKTAIGVAKEMANIKFPSMMILGGNGSNTLDPFQAIGLESFIKINKGLLKTE